MHEAEFIMMPLIHIYEFIVISSENSFTSSKQLESNNRKIATIQKNCIFFLLFFEYKFNDILFVIESYTASLIVSN